MLITVTAVGIEKAPKGYGIAVVSFNREGKPEMRKIMSFARAVVYQKLIEFKTFPFDANVVMVKNDKTGYWDWTDIEVQQGGTKVDGKPVGKVLGSNYETPAERARRQVYIIRQSSISSAIEMAKAVEPKGTTKTRQDILEDAKAFEAFVMEDDSFKNAMDTNNS